MNRDKAIKKAEGEAGRGERTRDRQAYSPNVDIMENKDGLVLMADMPGSAPRTSTSSMRMVC